MIDFDFLRQKGIEWAQQLCGETWTDYNLHDPGVTILEALCYALTDLSYRTDFPISDILSNKEGRIQGENNAFFSREDILTCNPVTVDDFRKWILDRVGSIHNAWLEPVVWNHPCPAFTGLYTLKVQVKKEYARHWEGEEGAARVTALELRTCFTSVRNLCEDLAADISILKPVSVSVRADIVVTGDQPEALLAAVYQALEAAINPPVKYYTEQELLDKGYRIEEIYQGPLLRKGFIPTGGLPPRTTIIDPAELMKAVSQVKGVVYVKNLSVAGPDGVAIRGVYKLADDCFPWFDYRLDESPIRLLKDKYEIRIHEAAFNDLLAQVEETARQSLEPMMQEAITPRTWHGQYRNIGEYVSVQRLFPSVYGIGADGLALGEKPARRAAARQLKVYLLFFEQLLANYLAQLAHLPQLFAANEPHTYYSQPLYDVPGVRDLLRAFTETADPVSDVAWESFVSDAGNAYRKALIETAETDEEYRRRKNRLLDHLLARFNERLISFPVSLYVSLYTGRTVRDRRDEVIEWKSDLLQRIARLGYDKYRGCNYLWNGPEEDRGGFFLRMAALLYIRPRPGKLSDALSGGKGIRIESVSNAAPITAAISPAAEEKNRQTRPSIIDESGMRQLSDAGRIRTEGNEKNNAWHFQHLKTSFFLHALYAGNYTIGPDPDASGGWVLLFHPPGDNHLQVIGRHADEASAIRSLKKLIARIREINIQSEGFYIVEHALLRPPLHAAAFGFRFLSHRRQALLQHTQWTSFSDRENAITRLLQLIGTAPLGGAELTTWAIHHLASLCRVQLPRHEAYGFMTDPADLQDWELAEAGPVFDAIRSQLLMLKQNRLRFFPTFEMLVKGLHEDQVPESFFRFSMTIVFPAWPARFQDPGFRQFAVDLFKMQAPAHTRIFFHWLNPARMSAFEDLYYNWTGALKTQDDPAAAGRWSEQLVHWLKRTHYTEARS